jgi:DNA-binding transcriptional ArsR family regulator
MMARQGQARAEGGWRRSLSRCAAGRWGKPPCEFCIFNHCRTLFVALHRKGRAFPESAASLCPWTTFFETPASAPRRQILAYLNEAELTTSDLAVRSGMTAPAISRHLSVLGNGELVKSERRGAFVYYSLNGEHLANTLTS